MHEPSWTQHGQNLRKRLRNTERHVEDALQHSGRLETNLRRQKTITRSGEGIEAS